MTVRIYIHPGRRRRRGMAALSALRWLLLIVGIAALSYTGYVYVESSVYQSYEEWSFDQRTEGKTPTIIGFLVERVFASRQHDTNSRQTAANRPAEQTGDGSEGASTIPPISPPEPSKPAAPADPTLIGRIIIPRLGVRAIVREGVDDKTLRHAVGHVPETVRPGVMGNIGLAGHRDSFFRPLKGIRKKDKILIETLNGNYEYQVDRFEIVGKNDVAVLAPSKSSILTLVTCYPFYYVGHAPRRFIVRAHLVSPEALVVDRRTRANSGE